ncbi:hypothetical protein MKX03_030454 [Papaver bracteatum]|nr:hypothetical protein MKX03_030454 [Papaver bracteatum]
MGASYNAEDINSQVTGGKNAVLQNLLSLQKQVRLFDNVHYLKAFGDKDLWVSVGVLLLRSTCQMLQWWFPSPELVYGQTYVLGHIYPGATPQNLLQNGLVGE